VWFLELKRMVGVQAYKSASDSSSPWIKDLPSEGFLRLVLLGSEDVFHDATHISFLDLPTHNLSGRVDQELIPILDPFNRIGAQKSQSPERVK
jgi:hypothetical protein